MVYIKFNEDGSFKFLIGKFFLEDELRVWGECFGVKFGDMVFILVGEMDKICK